MSRTKEPTSKKRKLADLNHEDTVLPSRTSWLPRNDSHKEPENAENAKGEERGKETPNITLESRAAFRQAKSERRSKKKQKEDLENIAPAVADNLDIEVNDGAREDQEQPQIPRDEETLSPNPAKQEAKQRFIVFVGNLPYSATTPAIQSHFFKLQPFTVRHSTNKETGRSRGFAFLEFEGYDKMKTCLKMYHHSVFDANGGRDAFTVETTKKSQARKINVELTVGGGGGKSAARKERIRGKNEKLEGERERARVHREKEEAAARRKKNERTNTGPNAIEVTDEDAEDENIHPSRRMRMKT
jgi:nucleolar protein 6